MKNKTARFLPSRLKENLPGKGEHKSWKESKECKDVGPWEMGVLSSPWNSQVGW